MMASEMEKAKDEWLVGMAEEGIVVEILGRLPVRSLLRFKATCKSWRTLIESPYFVEFHAGVGRQQHRYRDRLLFSQRIAKVYSWRPQIQIQSESDSLMEEFNSGIKLRKANNPFLLQDDALVYGLKVLGPLLNGIHCLILPGYLKSASIPRIFSFAGFRFALTNLATRAQHYLSPLPADIDIPPKANFSYGFGCIRNNSGIVVDYKLVLNFITPDDYDFLSFVYSLQRGSWEKVAHVRGGTPYIASDPNHKAVSRLLDDGGNIQTPRDIYPPTEGCPQRFFNGCWHWLGWLPATASGNYSDYVLLFDLLTEEFELFAGPPHDLKALTLDYTVESGLHLLDDRLAAVYMPCDVDSKGLSSCVGFHVWMMMEYGASRSWAKLYSCATPFHTFFYAVVGFSYSTTVAPPKDDSTSSRSCVQIHRILLEDGYTRQLVSIDGSAHIMEHSIYVAGAYDFYLNTLGVSSYFETLHSVTLPRTEDPSS